MKRVLCIVLSLIMILPCTAFASVTGEVSYSESEQNVYILGNLSNAAVKDGKLVTLTIKDSSGNIAYITEVEVGENLKYEFKFKFLGGLNDCVINVREGDNDVTQSVEVAYVTQPTVYSLTLRDENESHVIEADEIIKATAEITNKHGNDGKFQILAAFYNENNKMIGCEKIADGTFDFYDIKKEVSGFSVAKVPAGAETIKAFMWNDTKTMIPLSKEQVKATDDKTFGGDTEQITVAFMGDSLTHGAEYIKVLEHYYQTRYPNKDIVFVNKGISGNSFTTVMNRFDWDITENELSGEIDEATICLGFNDLGPDKFIEGVDYNNIPDDASDEVKESKKKIDASIDSYVEKCEKLIGMCRDKGIALTLITTFVYDHEMGAASATAGKSAFNYPGSVNDYGLSIMTDEVKKIADKYDLPVIDMWTMTSSMTDIVREKYGLANGDIVITGTDGVHPEEQGGFYMSYLFITQQDDTCATVAKVEIDALTGEKVTERADVTLNAFASNGVEYEYLAHAIPLAYTEHYKTWENWGVNVTEDLNNEIIKVTGLEDGEYTIKIGDSKLAKTYTAAELAEGVNIAIDANNPAQIQSKNAYDVARAKVKNEGSFRTIAITEQAIRNHPEADISKFDENTTLDELKAALGSSYTSHYKRYFTKNSNDYGSKFYEKENWAKIRAQEQQAKELSKPVKRTVVIEKL